MRIAKIHDVIQGTDEWKILRRGRLTASRATAIGNNGTGLQTYVRTKLAEYYSTAEQESYTDKDTERGNELEPLAREIYGFTTGNQVVEVGFVSYGDYIGCSPDGFVGEDGMVEIKCPSDKVYFDLLIDEKIDSGYMWQMQMNMLITGRKWCDYVVFNPNFKNEMFIKRVVADEEMFAKLLKGFDEGEKLLKELKTKYESL